jgi:hypothetical protein
MFNRAITAPNNTDERGIIWDYVQTDVIMDMISLGYGRHDERLEQAFDIRQVAFVERNGEENVVDFALKVDKSVQLL